MCLEEVIYEEVVIVLKNIFDFVYLKVVKLISMYINDGYVLFDIINCKCVSVFYFYDYVFYNVISVIKKI